MVYWNYRYRYGVVEARDDGRAGELAPAGWEVTGRQRRMPGRSVVETVGGRRDTARCVEVVGI
jgi:hypothetical protein